MSGPHQIGDVIVAYTNREVDVAEKRFVHVDVTNGGTRLYGSGCMYSTSTTSQAVYNPLAGKAATRAIPQLGSGIQWVSSRCPAVLLRARSAVNRPEHHLQPLHSARSAVPLHRRPSVRDVYRSQPGCRAGLRKNPL